jgi:hypothetical protein
LAAWLLVASLFAAPAAADQWQFEGVERVIALSDIHGAYAPMIRTLRSAAVIGDDDAWVAGKTHLVIVGDLTDRGPDSRGAMDFLMRLEREAETAGGKVHVLIGNHEVMNLVSDLRYVSRAEYAAFAGEERTEDREHWFEQFIDKRAEDGKSREELRQLFDRSFPPGFFAHRRAFGADGEYGRWLLDKPIMVVINGTAFVHGGVSPMVGELGLEGVNATLRDEMLRYVEALERLYAAGALLPTDNFYNHPAILADFLPPLDANEELMQAIAAAKELGNSRIHAPDGPLWYRGNAACSELVEADQLEATLASIGADRVVIGHTPTYGRRIYQRYGGTVIEVDTGMFADYYKGSGNAVVIEGDLVAVINESSPEPMPVTAAPRRVGQRPAGYLEARDIETLLATGDILAEREDEAGIKVVTVSDGENTLEAVFARRGARGVFPEAAAYRLDRLLGLDMVPVTVLRSVGRFEGTLQFLVPGSIDEAARAEKGYGAGAQCPLPGQWEAMLVWDALIYNEGRFRQTMRYSPDSWQLLLVGHDRAFAATKGVPPHLENQALALNNRWRRALEALTDDVLDEQLDGVLDKRRLRALATRRDELLSQP